MISILALSYIALVGASSTLLVSQGPHTPGKIIQASWRSSSSNIQDASLILLCHDTQEVLLESVQNQQHTEFEVPEVEGECRVALASSRRFIAISQAFIVSSKPMHGQLITLGYRSIDNSRKHDRNAKKPFFLLEQGNALIPDKSRSIITSHDEMLQTATSSIGFAINENSIVQIECDLDASKDMFQVGRAADNDFHVPGVVDNGSGASSRYAFRIVCSREVMDECFVYAAGFDRTQQIFLGPRAARFIDLSSAHVNADGLITYGLMLWTPSNKQWREISVMGGTFKPRSSIQLTHRLMPLFPAGAEPMSATTNQLEDGSIIINACSAYLWRSGEVNDGGWTPEAHNAYLDKMKSLSCPIQLADLQIDNAVHSIGLPYDQKPCFYKNCGHMFNQFPSAIRVPHNCPSCRTPGQIEELKVRYEPLISAGPPTHALKCGHAMSKECAEETMERPNPKYHEDQETSWELGSKRACPFCNEHVETQRQQPTKLVPEVD